MTEKQNLRHILNVPNVEQKKIQNKIKMHSYNLFLIYISINMKNFIRY